MNGQKLLVMDRNAIKYAPMSYEINKQEYVKLYPEMMHSRKLSFILKHEKPEIIPMAEAILLVRKFENLYLVDDKHKEITVEEAKNPFKRVDDVKDDLSDMSYAEIFKLANESYGINNQTFHSMKGVELKKEIRRRRSEELKEVGNETD